MTRYVVDLKKTEGSKVLLVCFPPAGASASFYKKWVPHFCASVDVAAIQLPGRSNRYSESLVTSMDYVINRIVSELAERCEQDSVFFGHSMGGLMAYLTAKRMSLDGFKVPSQLYISSSEAPKTLKYKKLWKFTNRGEYERICNAYPEIMNDLKNRIYLHALHDYDFLIYLKATGVLSEEMASNSDFMSVALPIIRADFRMLENAVYRESTNKLNIPMFVMSGDNENTAFKEDIKNWASKTSAVCAFKTFPGDHSYLKSSNDSVTSYINGSIALSFR